MVTDRQSQREISRVASYLPAPEYNMSNLQIKEGFILPSYFLPSFHHFLPSLLSLSLSFSLPNELFEEAMLEAILDERPCETDAEAVLEGILASEEGILDDGCAKDIGLAFFCGLEEEKEEEGGGEGELAAPGGDGLFGESDTPDWEDADERAPLPFI